MARKRKTVERIIKTQVKEVLGSTYTYNLTVTESEHVASYGIPLYSVAISECDVGGKVSEAKGTEIFADPGRAIAFYERLVRALATPTDLPYILEEEYSR